MVLAQPSIRVSSAAPAFSLSERFGADLLQLGWTGLPNRLLDSYARLGLSANEMMFTIHVLQHWWGQNTPHPSLATVAAKMGVSWRTVQRLAQRLARRQLLIIRHRSTPEDGQIASEYDFSPLFAAVAALPQTDPLATALADAPVTTGATPLSNLAPAPLSPVTYEEDLSPEKNKNQDSEDLRISKPPLSKTVWTAGRSDQPSTIASLAHELSTLLGDPTHQKSNATRLAKLLHWSELEPPEFLATVKQARQITASRRSLWRGSNRMPYFFSVLSNLLGVVEEKPTHLPISTPGSADLGATLRPTPPSAAGAATADDAPTSAEPATAGLWRTVLQQLQPHFSPSHFQTWLADTELLTLDDGQAIIGVPTAFAVEWLHKRCASQIEAALSAAANQIVRVQFRLESGCGR